MKQYKHLIQNKDTTFGKDCKRKFVYLVLLEK